MPKPIPPSTRALFSLTPLIWDQNLSNAAQEYANQLASKDSGLQHSAQTHGQGENLACCTGNWAKPFTEASNGWAAEKHDWHGGAVKMNEPRMVGHYTQMIWSSTTHVGMAVAVARSGTIFVVARYSPAGNIVGEVPHQASGRPSFAGNMFGQQQQGPTPANIGTNWPPAGVPGRQQQTPVNADANWPQGGMFGQAGRPPPLGFGPPFGGMDMPGPPWHPGLPYQARRRTPYGYRAGTPQRQPDAWYMMTGVDSHKEYGCCTIL
ncbi:hypothetical protein Q7P37_000586 [Cladosporium fusiforme]